MRGSRSCTPMEGQRESRLGYAPSRHSSGPGIPMQPAQAASDGMECNPSFWAWLHSQGVHSLDSVHSLYAKWQSQGCPKMNVPPPAPPSLSRNVSFSGLQGPAAGAPPVCASAPPMASHCGIGGDDNVRSPLSVTSRSCRSSSLVLVAQSMRCHMHCAGDSYVLQVMEWARILHQLTTCARVQFGGMHSFPGEARPGDSHSLPLRSSSSVGAAALPGLACMHGENEHLCSSDGGMMVGPPPSAPLPHRTRLYDTSGVPGMCHPRGLTPLRGSPSDFPTLTQTVPLAPDDHSWSRTRSATPPFAGPHLAQPPGLNHMPFSLSTLPGQGLPHHYMVSAPSSGHSGHVGSWGNSPRSSDMHSSVAGTGLQTPSPPYPPPGFLISSNRGPRQLLLMHSVHTPAALSGVIPAIFYCFFACAFLQRSHSMHASL